MIFIFQNESEPDCWAAKKTAKTKLRNLYTMPSQTDSNEKNSKTRGNCNSRSQKTFRRLQLQIFFKKGEQIIKLWFEALIAFPNPR